MSTNPIHLIVRLPYNRPANAPREPAPVEWTAQKDQFLWEVLSRSRGPDSAGIDWQGLADHLETPLPYLLFRAQARYEEDLRGLRDVTGMLALNLGAPAPADATSPARTAAAGPQTSTSLMQRILSSQAATSRVLSTRASVAPTPQRLSTPAFGPSHRTSPPHGTTHVRTPTRESNPGSESTMTLIQKPIAPLAAPASSSRPARPAVQDAESRSSSSSSSGSDDEGEEAQRRQEEEEGTRKRLQELERMMSSDMLGFARQQPRLVTRTPALPGQSMIITRPRSEVQGQRSILPEPSIGPVSATAASPPRGRPFPPPATRDTTWQPRSYVPIAAAQTPSYANPSPASHLNERPQSAASSAASRSKSGHGSIPSIPSPGESQSPSARSSTSATQSTSPSATDNSRSPSMVSPPPRGAAARHVKRLSLDGAVRGRGGGGGGGAGPSRVSSAHGQRQPGPRTASTQGSTTSSFSDISDMSMSASALEDALMSNINRGASSKL